MSYLQEVQSKLNTRNWPGFLQIWEEYCHGDIVDAIELLQILKTIKNSDYATIFGTGQLRSVLELWGKIADEEMSYKVLALIFDLQTSNSLELAELALSTLKKRYESYPLFNEKLRLVGLRSKENFKGALTNFDLLNHLEKGNYVFHTGGWGTGEIIDLSLLREQITLEFDQVPGRKDMTFESAFKNLQPLNRDHFLARRFSDPVLLEKEAKNNPAAIIRLLLRDIGDKTASEIKEELCGSVILEEDWSKWWQNARAKIKKDTFIETPSSLKAPFRLRQHELSHEDRFLKTLNPNLETECLIEKVYQFCRDYPLLLRKNDFGKSLHEQLQQLLEGKRLFDEHTLELLFIAEDLLVENGTDQVKTFLKGQSDPASLIAKMDIMPYKKRALQILQEINEQWPAIFLEIFQTAGHPMLREYILKELQRHTPSHAPLNQMIGSLLENPQHNPELFIWLFQKVINGEIDPYNQKEDHCRFLESFLILLSRIEQQSSLKDLAKKMHGMLFNQRYALVRKIIEGTSIEYLQEFLLLVSKCHSLSDHDLKILQSLAEVVQPSLAKEDKQKGLYALDAEIIWTTKEGFEKVQNRVRQIGTVETIENAKEIETARAHGDLRENSEYKFALERRARLQAELKFLSMQMNKARVITEQDIAKEEIGVGNIVDLESSKGEIVTYTLLGPWDADPENNILSFQSKFAQAMVGKKVGDRIQFQDEEYRIKSISSFFASPHA